MSRKQKEPTYDPVMESRSADDDALRAAKAYTAALTFADFAKKPRLSRIQIQLQSIAATRQAIFSFDALASPSEIECMLRESLDLVDLACQKFGFKVVSADNGHPLKSTRYGLFDNHMGNKVLVQFKPNGKSK